MNPHQTQLTNAPEWLLEWQMTNCERLALTKVLERVQPEVSLEIGTYRGGSLQVLAQLSKRVIAVDIDPAVAQLLDGKFPNVEFRCGDSRDLLPAVIGELNAAEGRTGFVLIDGDHSADGVCRDIDAVLKLKPKGRVVIILHDSFNPECRAGMRRAAWAACPYVQFVELDFVPGVYHYEAHDTAEARSMWGGFACAVLEPEPRTGALSIGESQRGLFEAVFRDSSHAASKTPGLALRALRKLKRMVRG